MKRELVSSCVVIFAALLLTAKSANAEVDLYSMGSLSTDPNKPGCYMTFSDQQRDRLPKGSVTGRSSGVPCKVYRNGEGIGSLLTNPVRNEFTDYDVIPGETYTYEICGQNGKILATTGERNITCYFIYDMELGTRTVAFDADDSTGKTVSYSLYKRTVDGKTAVSQRVSYICDQDWINVDVNTGGVNIWVEQNGTDAERIGFVTLEYNGFKRTIKVMQAGKATPASYSLWAAKNGVDGAWDEKDENKIHNVFRYAFEMPTGKFTETPFIDIVFLDGKPIIKTPAVVNSVGFTFSVEVSDKPDGTGNAASYPLNASGTTTIEEDVRQSRFFRLKANPVQ